MAGVVADADAEQRRALDTVVVKDKSGGGGQQLVRDVVDVRIGSADKPLRYQGPEQPMQGSGSGGGGRPRSAV